VDRRQIIHRANDAFLNQFCQSPCMAKDEGEVKSSGESTFRLYKLERNPTRFTFALHRLLLLLMINYEDIKPVFGMKMKSS